MKSDHCDLLTTVIDAETGWYFVPATIKAVVLSSDGDVLLARNLRGSWELLGGWPSRPDRTIEDTLRREVSEEASLEIEVHELLHAELELSEERQVVIVAYRCSCVASDAAIPSTEHQELMWARPDAIDRLDLAPPYRLAIKRAAHLALRTSAETR